PRPVLPAGLKKGFRPRGGGTLPRRSRRECRSLVRCWRHGLGGRLQRYRGRCGRLFGRRRYRRGRAQPLLQAGARSALPRRQDLQEEGENEEESTGPPRGTGEQVPRLARCEERVSGRAGTAEACSEPATLARL